MHAALGYGDAVQGAVELTVAATVEAVALVFAGAGVEGCDAGVAGELRVGCEAVDRADLAEQLGCAQRSAAGELEQRRCERERARMQFPVELATSQAQRQRAGGRRRSVSVVCSRRAGCRASRSSQTARSSAPNGTARCGSSSCRCQRNRC